MYRTRRTILHMFPIIAVVCALVLVVSSAQAAGRWDRNDDQKVYAGTADSKDRGDKAKDESKGRTEVQRAPVGQSKVQEQRVEQNKWQPQRQEQKKPVVAQQQNTWQPQKAWGPDTTRWQPQSQEQRKPVVTQQQNTWQPQAQQRKVETNRSQVKGYQTDKVVQQNAWQNQNQQQNKRNNGGAILNAPTAKKTVASTNWGAADRNTAQKPSVGRTQGLYPVSKGPAQNDESDKRKDRDQDQVRDRDRKSDQGQNQSTTRKTGDRDQAEVRKTTPPKSGGHATGAREFNKPKVELQTPKSTTQFGGVILPKERVIQFQQSQDKNRARYEDIGRIWRDRALPSISITDKNRRDPNWWANEFTRRHRTRPAYHRHYSWIYEHRRTFPSIYCFYFGYLPPFILSYNVYWEPRPIVYYDYITIPLNSVIYDGYYLNRQYNRNLTYTLRDIRRAWELGSPEMLMSHVDLNQRIGVFIDGQYSYSLPRETYYDMTRDAMETLQTGSFQFYRVDQRRPGEVVAYAKHIYYDETNGHNVVHVSYTLIENYGSWHIVEVGSSSDQL